MKKLYVLQEKRTRYIKSGMILIILFSVQKRVTRHIEIVSRILLCYYDLIQIKK
jgi:hypothetical protein